MGYDVKQIYTIINDAVEDALGKNNSISQLDTTDFVSLGKSLNALNLLEGWFGALTNRIAKTVYFARTYEPSTRSVLRDEMEYGAFIQKVYYDMPTAVENATWEIPNGDGDYVQASPYDVETTINVSAKIFGGKGTWSIEIVRPIEQIKTAFLGASEMMSFIDGIYVTIENAFKLEEERLTALAVNTSMAMSIKKGNARNLLDEYNTLHPTNTLTVAECLENADFLKYASKEINRTIDNMGKMSTAFNAVGYATFTNKDNLVVEMLSEFASASDMYLQADTFHNELTKLPNYEKIPFWQSSGKAFAFADCSKINIENDGLKDSTVESDTGVVEQGGIICFLHDIENVMATFGNKRSWEMVNPRSEVVIHGEKAEKGFAVDGHANAVVFYVAE